MGSQGTLVQVLGGAGADTALIIANGPQFRRQALQQAITDTAARLVASGIRPGDVVALSITNTVEFVVGFLAVTYARAVAAPLNPAYTKGENHFYLDDGKAVLLIVPTEGNAAAQAAAQQLNVPMASISVQAQGTSAPQVHLAALPGTRLSFQAPGMRTLPSNPLASDIALFLHTSGTTGRPKGVPLSHGNLTASLTNIIGTYELNKQDVSYLVMPLFHVHGLMAGLLSPLAAGGTVVLPQSGKFSAAHFWSDCCNYKATFYTAVPTIHQVLLARADKDYPAAHPPPLRFIRSCSSALAPSTLEKLEGKFKVPVLEAYAMTEASHQMCSNPLPKHGPRKPGTVGRAQGGVKVAILDNQNRLVVPGQIGEVCIRGPNVMAGYLNNPNANQEAFAGGWFHTGDQGFLDEEGYVTLTGRIKELINRGGEKISPLEVDAALLAHPAVAEAVSFGAPDEKYGEVVAAAVVLKPGSNPQGIEASIKQHCAKTLSAFKVPGQIFITDVLPKTATGKIQRRHMVAAFIKPGGSGGAAQQPKPAAAPAASSAAVPGIGDGYELVARSLAKLGVTQAYGVVGIPVTPLASSMQAAGIRFFGMRNEQAAGYAAAAAGFLTGRPAVLLTVSGPGAVHGIAGASHATVNCFPLIMLSGSAEQDEIGKGSFQELDQVAALAPHCKLSARAEQLHDIPHVLARAYNAACEGRPGAAYVDLPSNMLLTRGDVQQDLKHVPTQLPAPSKQSPVHAGATDFATAAQLLLGASRPLVVLGKGAALAQAEVQVQHLINRFGLPALCTSMGRGLVPDNHPLCVNAARSAALKGADVALVVGARLNWQLHFGEQPRWAADVKFILLDIAPSERDAGLAAAVLCCDAKTGLTRLNEAMALEAHGKGGFSHIQPWLKDLTSISHTAADKLSKRLAAIPTTSNKMMDYYTALGAVRAVVSELQPPPIVVSEGANTMDMARLLLPVMAPRTRLDAGTWGTMGVGLGYAIAAAANAAPGQVVLAIEGDSAFGFSGMELEVMQRYKLPIIVLVMNNGGIYGGDRRAQPLMAAAAEGAAAAGFGSDPAPTSFVDTRYNLLMEAFGGNGVRAASAAQVCQQLRAAIQHALQGKPSVIDVVLDPMAGSESGSVHAFNAPPKHSKL